MERFDSEGTSAAERRRSRSDAADVQEPECPSHPGPAGGQAGGAPSRADGPSGGPPEGELESAPRSAEETAGLPKAGEEPIRLPRLAGARPGRRLVRQSAPSPKKLTPEQRLLMLDTWQRSGLPAGEFAPLVGVSKHTLYKWKKRFQEEGPAGLMDTARRCDRKARLPELTRRTILMLKEANPDWGCQRISDMLLRGPALAASPATVARVLHEGGYELQEVHRMDHRPPVRRYERARPNELWQTDLFTFILKRQNRRVYLVVFMDDHSRFVVGYGLHASQSSALVMEVLRAALTSYGLPGEILTDNGSQYVTWRGKSAFSKELQRRGIKHIVASPRRPQTLGKVERFWGTLWRECLERAVFVDMAEARVRVGLFIDHYNFQRTHQGIGGLVPADRFFGAAPEVLRTLKARVEANSLELARSGLPKKPFYLTGQVGGKAFSVHAEGEKVILTSQQGEREEVDLAAPGEPEKVVAGPDPEQSAPELPEALCPDGSPICARNEAQDPPPPGVSPLDEALERIAKPTGGDHTENGGQ